MTDAANLNFIRQRIPQSSRSLMDILTTDEQECKPAAADRWLLEATTSHFGQNKFVWSELLMDLAHCYPFTQDDDLTVVPLFYHMSAKAQRLVLSFIYVHREHIPLGALKDFADALFNAASILPTSGWIRTLLELLMVFCSMRMKVSLEESYTGSSGRFDIGTRHEMQNAVSHAHRQNAVVFKQTTDYDFSSLKDIVHHQHIRSSLWEPDCQISGSDDRKMELEKEIDVSDMKTEMSVEFSDTAIVAATQHATDDSVTVLSQKQTDDAIPTTELSAELQALAEYLKNTFQKSEVVSSIESLLHLTTSELEALCDAVGFNEMSDSSISAACQSLCSSSASHFSFENCCIFAQHLLLPPLKRLYQPASRLLIAALTLFAGSYPRALMFSVIVPVLGSESCNAFQADVFLKLVNTVLNLDHYAELLRHLMQSTVWSESALDIIQYLVDKKPVLTDADLNLLITTLRVNNSAKHSSSLKFGKLMLSMVLAYGSKMTGMHIEQLKQLGDQHQSFMKKSFLSSVAKLRA